MKCKLWELALVPALVLGLLFGGVAEQQQELTGSLLRLHVVANSDSEQDQALKLQVRDRLLPELSALLENCADKAAALETAEAALPRLQALAEELLQAAGQPAKVAVSLRQEAFPTVEYETFRLPAGRYDSLRVVLGEGSGHNWWCVVFPALCLRAAEDWTNTGLSPSTVQVISGDSAGVKLRFRLLEWAGTLLN